MKPDPDAPTAEDAAFLVGAAMTRCRRDVELALGSLKLAAIDLQAAADRDGPEQDADSRLLLEAADRFERVGDKLRREPLAVARAFASAARDKLTAIAEPMGLHHEPLDLPGDLEGRAGKVADALRLADLGLYALDMGLADHARPMFSAAATKLRSARRFPVRGKEVAHAG